MLFAENQHELDRRYDEVYERFARPLEQDHRGEFVAIAPDGRLVLGTDLLEVAQKASVELGPGNFVFRIGERSVGRWR